MSTKLSDKSKSLIETFEFNQDGDGESKRHAAHAYKLLNTQYHADLTYEAQEAKETAELSNYRLAAISGFHNQVSRYIYHDNTTSNESGNPNTLRFWEYVLTGGMGQYPREGNGTHLDIRDVSYIIDFERIQGEAWGFRDRVMFDDSNSGDYSIGALDLMGLPIKSGENGVTFTTNTCFSQYSSSSAGSFIGIILLDETEANGYKLQTFHSNTSTNSSNFLIQVEVSIPANTTALYVSSASVYNWSDIGDLRAGSLRHQIDWRPMIEAGGEVDKAWLNNFWSGRITGSIANLWKYYEGITDA